VVANDIGAWTNIISKEKVGIITQDDPQDFASRILELIEDEELIQEYGSRGLSLAKNKYQENVAGLLVIGEDPKGYILLLPQMPYTTSHDNF